MQPLAQLAEQTREQRRSVSPDNPFVKLQEQVSEQIVKALDAWRDLRDTAGEQFFIALYSSPLLQALLGLKASDEAPRRRPGLEPEDIAFIRERIAELKAKMSEGGEREAVIRSLIYICLAGPGPDERVFNLLRRIRAEHGGLSLQEFKQVVREQYLMLRLDEAQSLAAITQMLPDDSADRKRALDIIRHIVSAIGIPTDQPAERLAHIESLFNTPAGNATRSALTAEGAAEHSETH
jgi:hypothetical protein